MISTERNDVCEAGFSPSEEAEAMPSTTPLNSLSGLADFVYCEETNFTSGKSDVWISFFRNDNELGVQIVEPEESESPGPCSGL